jgi:hypothetical protein
LIGTGRPATNIRLFAGLSTEHLRTTLYAPEIEVGNDRHSMPINLDDRIQPDSGTTISQLMIQNGMF